MERPRVGAAPRVVPAPAARARRVRRLLGAAVLAVLLVVGGLARASHRSAATPLPAAGHVAADYHVTYAVTRGDVHTTEELWVNRPFESEQIVYDAQRTQLSRIVSRLGRQSLTAGGAPAVMEVGPAAPQFDQRLDAVAGVTSARVLQRRGHHTVAGTACGVVRTRGVLAADFTGTPTDADHVDSCVSAAGIVLAETSVSSGRVVSRKVATKVTVGAAAARHTFATPGTHVPRQQGGGRIVTLDPSSRPPGQEFWELAAAPEGYSHLGRFAVVAPSPGSAAPTVTSVVDVYVHAADQILVEQGETLNGSAMAGPVGAKVALGRLGDGRLTVSPVASSLAVLTAGRGTFVRVSGTVAPARLVAVARALRAQPGGTLVTIAELTSDGAS